MKINEPVRQKIGTEFLAAGAAGKVIFYADL